MGRGKRDQDLRVGGMSLRTKFTLSMSLSLAIVMAFAGFLLVRTVTTISQQATDERLLKSVALTASAEAGGQLNARGKTFTRDEKTGVERRPVTYKAGNESVEGELLVSAGRDGSPAARLLIAPDSGEKGRGLIGLIILIMALVIGVGAIVSVLVANQVAGPIEGLVDDVRHLAGGNLSRRTQVRGAREVVLLGRTLDRMASSLREAQDAELELMARERELAVADEVREALLPEATPYLENYEVGGLQIGCPEPGGDFYDYVERTDGKLGLLLCEVSGKGVPGALVAATARSYLRAVLASAKDVKQGLCEVNRFFAPDVRRGMYVTALYALLDVASGSVELACAGHQVPLLRYCAADGQLRKLQPDGIALGMDKGPIFERSLTTERFVLEVGDRLVLSNAGPQAVLSPQGEELGESGFARGILKRAGLSTDELLEDLDLAFETYADGEPYPSDISILTLSRLS
jgi:serine phosphatase RsbU (regulator of sigma subunit)